MMISANALRKRGGRGFRRPGPGLFSGGDVALDSAGFVAMFRYGGYPWTVDEYVDLAASYPWTWWAQMDFCCEPEVARDREEILRRQNMTTQYMHLCRNAAEERGIKMPMPVLQGWTPSDYVRSFDLLGNDIPDLLGVGSVCRRQLGGKDGLISIIEEIGKIIPESSKLHLFGVKGAAVPYLVDMDMVASTDSMAWDFGCRRRRGDQPYNVEVRERWMRDWYRRQVPETVGA